MDTSEKRFEQDIEKAMKEIGGLESFSYQDESGKWNYKYYYDAEKALYLDVLIDFIKNTQEKSWQKYLKLYKDDAPNKLYRRFEDSVNEYGLIYVLKNGIEDMGVKIKLCYFKPESKLNQTDEELYKKNIVGVTRQFAYSANNHKTIDMVISINGIPIIALELKNQFKGQDYNCAIKQYKEDRDKKELCFRLNHRFLVYFAVDLYEVWMTTELKNEKTWFMPFNQGSNGAGNSGGSGNPINENGYSTSYLWEEVLTRDSILDIIKRFITYVEEKEYIEIDGVKKRKTNKKVIFPRYHQFDVVHKVIEDVKLNGSGHNYLIEHSAGSGKSNSIAWIAYRLSSLHDETDKAIFNSVIVVTNRVVLDSQLQDTINSFDHTEGLVDTIDEKKRSKGLKEAINDGKRIIVCTVQKFLYAYKDFDDMSGKNFAIIIDEAHQGQSGESAKTLRKSLIDKNIALKDYTEEELDDIVEDEDEIVDKLIAHGRHTNQSFFAFTATPKNKTIELFGRYNEKTNKTESFHVYSMRQAIEEGFILDVLRNYTTIKEAFKLIKVSKDNPELIEGPAAEALVRYYKEDNHTIVSKTEMIMNNFCENGRWKIGGKGKAMVVADSRVNAVQYYQAIKHYIKDLPHNAEGCDVLVAFSGEVKIKDKSYTENSLNIDEDGKPINSDKKLRKAFKSDKYNILVVANKYQTGFDEPLLHSMYIDKKLKDINAVQTISRLNRMCKEKEDTFVLDFKNEAEDIKKSFQPYYEEVLLDGNTDYNKVYDLRKKVRDYNLYNDNDVDKFYEAMAANEGNNQNSIAIGKITGILKPIVNLYSDLSEDDKHCARDYMTKFKNNYSYISQLVRIHDKELYKEYIFVSHLLKLIPKDKKVKIDINDKIKLEYVSLKESFIGSIALEKKESVLKPTGSGLSRITTKKKDTLKSIIDKVNERYSGDFTDSDKVVVEDIFNRFMNDKDIKKYEKLAKDNDSEMFTKNLFPDKFNELMANSYMDNNESYKKLQTDNEFYKLVMELMARELYMKLRG